MQRANVASARSRKRRAVYTSFQNPCIVRSIALGSPQRSMDATKGDVLTSRQP